MLTTALAKVIELSNRMGGGADAAKSIGSIAARIITEKTNVPVEAVLLSAILDKDEAVVEALARAPGIDVNRRAHRFDRKTLLHYAFEQGSPKIFRSLLNAPGIDVNACDRDLETVLHYWSKQGRLDETAMALLNATGLDINARAEHLNWTALHSLVHSGSTSAVKAILTHPGIDVNAPDEFGYTPMHWAALQGHEQIVAMLLNATGIDVHPRCNFQSPLRKAVERRRIPVIKLLLAHPDTRVNALEDGFSCLYVAVRKGYHDVVELLLNATGIDVNIASRGTKETAMHVAASTGRLSMIKTLLAAPGIKVNARDRRLWSPLHHAVHSDRLTIVQALLEDRRVNSNAKDMYGRKPAALARQGRNHAIAEMLDAHAMATWSLRSCWNTWWNPAADR